MKKIILALDVFELGGARRLVEETSEFVDVFKVGPILFLKAGREIVELINGMGKKVFLDMKFHDIPATVSRCVSSARDLGIYSLTVHSIGGVQMLEAAVAVKDRPKIWAVTVLTSQVAEPDEVIKRAKLAQSCGVDGVIASPLEIAEIKKNCGAGFEVVTPGIRQAKIDDDQKRVATAEAAIRMGADFIVVGRPIIEAQNPREAAKGIFESIKGIV
jgi:orotidine-5'-phosphate decarboxylase